MVGEVRSKNGTHKYTVSADTMASILPLAIAIDKTPPEISEAELIRIVGMVLLDFGGHGQTARGYFCSEGYFNGSASVFLMEKFAEYMVLFKEWTTGQGVTMFSQGEIGDIIDRILLLRAVMTAPRSPEFAKDASVPKTRCEMIFEPVNIRDFLAAYAGNGAAQKYLARHKELEDAHVSFSHFVYMGEDDLSDSPYDVAANMLARGAALVPKIRSYGVDAFIPLVLRDGRISFVYVQTKFGKSFKRHPSDSDVAKDSPNQRLNLQKSLRRLEKAQFLDDDEDAEQKTSPYCGSQIPPYLYIYRTFNGSKDFSFKVVTGDRHQPCLSLFGNIFDVPSSSTDHGILHLNQIIKWFTESFNQGWSGTNDSIKNVWRTPEMRLTRTDTAEDIDINLDLHRSSRGRPPLPRRNEILRRQL